MLAEFTQGFPLNGKTVKFTGLSESFSLVRLMGLALLRAETLSRK